jgi:hypothetical protein
MVFYGTMITLHMTLLMCKLTNIVMGDGWVHPLPKILLSLCSALTLRTPCVLETLLHVTWCNYAWFILVVALCGILVWIQLCKMWGGERGLWERAYLLFTCSCVLSCVSLRIVPMVSTQTHLRSCFGDLASSRYQDWTRESLRIIIIRQQWMKIWYKWN